MMNVSASVLSVAVFLAVSAASSTAGGQAPPAGGAMLAVARTIRGGRMSGFEFRRIVERDGTLVYIAQPGGRSPTEFRLTRIAAGAATFENPAHDFPKMIRYARQADGSVEARVSDSAGGNAEVYRFRPVR